MARVKAGENSKKLKDSKNHTIPPKNLKGSQYMSPEQRKNYGKKLSDLLESLEEAKSELKKRKFGIELKKDTKISEKGIEKVVELERKTEKEVEEIAMPVSKLLCKKKTIKLRGKKIIDFLKTLEKQVEQVQELCKKLELNAKTEKEDLNKLVVIEKENPKIEKEDLNKLVVIEKENPKIEKEDLNKLVVIEKESKKCCRELVSYMPNSNNPRILYTFVIGAVLAVGLVASTILEHTTRLDILAIIGIATASALVAGGATYEALRPNTKIDESKEVQIKSSHHSLS